LEFKTGSPWISGTKRLLDFAILIKLGLRFFRFTFVTGNEYFPSAALSLIQEKVHVGLLSPASRYASSIPKKRLRT
jgi:hypothetical protein